MHSVRVTLKFVDIAFDECRPKRMAGYGEVDPAASTEVSGLVDEMQGIISRLDAYLAQDQSVDLQTRLQRLEEAGADLGLVRALERSIDQYGMVEFRPALGTIIDRFETNQFEIAVFGRVSSGKSSLLNHIAGQDVLPIGANPITAVPTRLIFGAQSRATAWFADQKPEQFAIDRLAEFVTEERNPGNLRHVTRIVVELPAEHLRDGIVYVDTPGLGSLATSGAAETKAYLPRCDLGVVLIDAGSTLTEDDLATIQALYLAGIPASVLLSKADLLLPAECERARQYVSSHLQSDLNLQLPVHAVSVKDGYSQLLDRWLKTEILPLYDRHAELARQSLNRKIGALRLGVEAALKARLRTSGRGALTVADMDPSQLRELETELRMAAGRIAEARTKCMDMTDMLRGYTGGLVGIAANNLVDAWESGQALNAAGDFVRAKMEQVTGEEVAKIAFAIREAASLCGRTLAMVAQHLKVESGPPEDELLDVLTNMPRLDLGHLEIRIAPSRMAAIFGRRWAVKRIKHSVASQNGEQIGEALITYSRVIQAWVRKTFAEFQEQFDSYADAYRAQLDRLLANRSVTMEDEQALHRHLAALSAAVDGNAKLT
jgi:GTP-binding protein EngB required for normal cell division